MNWTKNGSVHACAPYVIEPHTETYGVIRYRLTGPGLDELSRSVDALKRMAESHLRRHLADAAEQRKREREAQERRRSVERHQAEIRDRAASVLVPAHHPDGPCLDWSELDHAEHADRTRREAAELFERRQERLRREAEERRQAEVRARAQSALPTPATTPPSAPRLDELQHAESLDRARREAVERFEQREAETKREAEDRRRAEIIERAERALPISTAPSVTERWDELTRDEQLDRTRRESTELFDQRQQADARGHFDEEEQRRLAILRGRRAEGYPEVKCPGCKADLNATARSFVEDTDLVRYRCVHCDTRSAWDFDAPVPVLVMA